LKSIKNILYNLIGNFLPILVGIITIPILIKHVGTDRFGIITLAWMLIGYFSLFDMGMGRALTQLTAKSIGMGNHHDVPIIFWTSSLLMLIFSLIGSLIMSILAFPLAHHILKVPIELRYETVHSIYILCLSIPFVILTASCVGFLSAYNRFDIINAIRVPSGVFSLAGPLIILPFSINLAHILSVLTLGRFITFIIHLYYCYQTVPELRYRIKYDKSVIKSLFKFGGWMTISNVIGPIMVHFDRFFIGSVVSISAVTYYATPYEVVSKLFIIPTAVMSVLFPLFASKYIINKEQTVIIMSKTVKYLILIMFPIVLLIVTASHDGIALWLGDDFSNNSYRVMQLLTIGIFINCIAMVPFNYIQSIGKPDITSKFHLIELIIYIPLLFTFVKYFGIIGAAISWVIRITLDTILLFKAADKLSQSQNNTNYILLGFCIFILFMEMLLITSSLNYILSICFLVIFTILGWHRGVEQEDRASIFMYLTSLRKVS
jgi:O-antigen/teichoic acid export membrane protein